MEAPHLDSLADEAGNLLNSRAPITLLYLFISCSKLSLRNFCAAFGFRRQRSDTDILRHTLFISFLRRARSSHPRHQ